MFRSVLVYSEIHISTGSTLASFDIQSSLDERFIDDFEEREMPVLRESSDEEGSF